MEETSPNINLNKVKSSTLSGFVWNSIDKGGNYLISFIFGIFTIRILSPEDYGLFGLILIFYSISTVLIDFGLGTVLIQIKDTNQKDFNTVFLFNLISGIFLFIVVYFLAPLISAFYNEPRLTKLLQFLSISFIFNAASSTFITYLIKNLEFKKNTLINFINSLIFGSSTLFFALMGYNYWALVFGYLFSSFFTFIFYFIFSEWKPKFEFNFSNFKNLIGKGSYLLILNVINSVRKNIMNNFIGKRFDINSVGYVDRSFQIENYFSNSFALIIQKSILPNLIILKDNDNLLKHSLLIIIKIISFISFLLTGFLFINADEIFIILFTEKWIISASYFKIIIYFAGLYPIIISYHNLFLIKNLNKQFFNIEIISFIIFLITLYFTSLYSIELILWGKNFYLLFNFLIYIIIVKKFINFSVTEQLKIIFNAIYIPTLVSISLHLFKSQINFHNIYINLIIFSSLYFILITIISLLVKNNAFIDIINIIKNYLNNLFKKNN